MTLKSAEVGFEPTNPFGTGALAQCIWIAW